MKRSFKLKIYGESPRSLFLAYVLARLKYDVYLYDFSIKSISKKDCQIFVFSDFLKDLLIKFDIWDEIEEISYSFTSMILIDNLVSEQLLLRSQNISKKYLNTFGWTSNYSDIKSLLINKLINFDNVHFISKNHLFDENFIFDYEFNFKSYNKRLNLFKFPLSTFKKKDEQILFFNVYLRGHVEKRLYEINTTKGLLVLTPLNKNLYQVIWNNASFEIKETSLRSKSLFLDNLTTLLPNELKVDQIKGDISYLHVSNSFTTCLIKNKSIYFNENKFKSNTLFDFNFSIIIRIVLQLSSFLESNQSLFSKILNRFGFYYLLGKYIEIIINLLFSISLHYLFKVNNIFSLFFRKLLFSLFKKVNLLRFLIIRSHNISNIDNLFK